MNHPNPMARRYFLRRLREIEKQVRASTPKGKYFPSRKMTPPRFRVTSTSKIRPLASRW